MVLYLIGRDGPLLVMALGWTLLIGGVWAGCWVAGKWRS